MKNAVLLLIVILSFLFISVVNGLEDCPYGEIDCDTPCGLYVDPNGDGICDRSQEDEVASVTSTMPTTIATTTTVDSSTDSLTDSLTDYSHEITGQELKTLSVLEVADIYNIDAKEFALKLEEYLGVDVGVGEHFQHLHDLYGAEPSVIKQIASDIAIESGSIPDSDPELPATSSRGKRRYHILEIAISLTALYIISWLLSKNDVISVFTHRRIWNILLLITFLLSGILGILLVLKVNYGWFINSAFVMLNIHVEVGTAMAVISVFHVLWHLTYFKRAFGIKNKVK